MSDLPTTVASDMPKPAGPKGMHRAKPIVFSCPNGHRIVVDAAMAGKTGRCKECKAVITVPQPDGVASEPVQRPPQAAAPPPAAGAASDSRLLHREPTDGPSLIINEPSPPRHRSPAAAERTVIGEPLIEEESALAGLSIDPTEVQINFGDEDPADGGAAPVQRGNDAEQEPAAEEGTTVSTVLVNPTARLMERLWYERRHGGVIEVHLTGAVSPILPTYFYPAWSDGSHGLFASLAADGTVTLTAVAWDSVQKIVVRHVDSIPPDFLDIGLDE